MNRAELIVIAFVMGFICGAAFTLAYMGNESHESNAARAVVLRA